MALRLNGVQEQLLREAADNGGVIHTGWWMPTEQRKAVERLIRTGLLSSGHPAGDGRRSLTSHGRAWLQRNADGGHGEGAGRVASDAP
jgi:hypothetical protein